ncbi:DUF924 domain-containing protein [Hyphomonas sp. WL0036]|uniref:DUF924 family protein n=1 Tax=Hyphomonas sediminis TaxID=2866160 RepID=UPI001C7F95C2|nr:DUF924 family protein [Hyphomonas sediminis]MBY9065425.1 DUF924 domain-containing protein [Hyphomonas sediminis]
MSALPSPEDVLAFWIGDASTSPEALAAQNKKWFQGGDAFDRELRDRFLPLLETLSAGPLARDWTARGARDRLAAIIVLDQMSRNIFRGSPRAFAQDMLALALCKEGLIAREDLILSEAERVFYYLPMEHSEEMGDQIRSVDLFTALAASARDGFKGFCDMTLDYARKHLDVIEEFGRFPHRNAVVGRTSTDAEQQWLAEGGGF